MPPQRDPTASGRNPSADSGASYAERSSRPYETPKRPATNPFLTHFQPARKTAVEAGPSKPKRTPRMTATRETTPPEVVTVRRRDPDSNTTPFSRKNIGRTPIRVAKTARHAAELPASQPTLDQHFGPYRRKQADRNAPREHPVEVIVISSDEENSPPPVARASRSMSRRGMSSTAESRMPSQEFQMARKTMQPRPEPAPSSSPYNPGDEYTDHGSDSDISNPDYSDINEGAIEQDDDDDDVEDLPQASQGSSSQARLRKPFATPLRAELAVTPAVPPATSVRQLRPRLAAPRQLELSLTEDESASDKDDNPMSYFDKAVLTLWQVRRLPFLPRTLRRAVEPYMEFSLGHLVRLGVPRDQVDERWVCPLCPIFGLFSSSDARDMHIKFWHEEYNGRVISNNTLRAGKTTAPPQAREYVPTHAVKRPAQGLHFPHISERVTGLQPMPNFGYMRDRVRFEEMRVLARPGPLPIFVAAWKRWIFEHREDFIAAPARALGSFLHKYAEPVRVAGRDVLKAWLLALVNQDFITQFEFVDIYGEWAKAERKRAERLSAETGSAAPPTVS